MSTTIVGADGIAYVRLASLKGRLKLEGLGMRFRGQSTYRQVRGEFGGGSRAKVIEEIERRMQEILTRKENAEFEAARRQECGPDVNHSHDEEEG